MAVEGRRSIAATILEVELVRELVQHQVHSIVRLRRTAMHRVPRQHQRAKSLRGVPEPVFAGFFPDTTTDVPLFIGDVTGWIDENRCQLGVVIGLTMLQEQASLSGDRDADLVGEHETAAALKMFLGEKYLGVAEQLGLVFGV